MATTTTTTTTTTLSVVCTHTKAPALVVLVVVINNDNQVDVFCATLNVNSNKGYLRDAFFCYLVTIFADLCSNFFAIPGPLFHYIRLFNTVDSKQCSI